MKVFELFDEENTGFITFKSLKRVCEELNESLYAMCFLFFVMLLVFFLLSVCVDCSMSGIMIDMFFRRCR
jgi:hypothetical protein